MSSLYHGNSRQKREPSVALNTTFKEHALISKTDSESFYLINFASKQEVQNSQFPHPKPSHIPMGHF